MSKKAIMNNNLPHSSMNVQVVSCHLMHSPYNLYQPIEHFNLMTSLSSSISGGLWARFILYFVSLHHVMCLRTKYIGGRGRSHKVGPAAKVGPCPFAVVHNGTSNLSLLVLSNVPESTNERYQNTSNAISKT